MSPSAKNMSTVDSSGLETSPTLEEPLEGLITVSTSEPKTEVPEPEHPEEDRLYLTGWKLHLLTTASVLLYP